MKRNLFRRLLALTVAVLMLLPVLAVPIIAADSAESTTGSTQQNGYAVSGFENVKTTGSNLRSAFHEYASVAQGSMRGYLATLKPNTWYYLKYTESAVMTGSYALLYAYYRQGKEVFSYLCKDRPELLFYTGSDEGSCTLLLQGSTQNIGINKYSLYQVASFDSVYDVRYTSFAQDHDALFPEIDLSKYSGVSGDFIEPLTVYENIEIAEDYTWDGQVYLYLFNPSGKWVTGGTLTCPDDDGKSTPFEMKRCVSKGEDPRFVKLEVTGHWWHQYKKNDDGSLNIHNRRRRITDLTLKFEDGSSKTFPYNGSFVIEDKQTGDKVTAKSVKGNFESKINLEINYTYYRTDTSPKGKYYHNQVDSIYFNVPNYLKESYGKLVDVKLSYQRARTEPIFVTDDTTLYSYLKDNLGKDASTYNSNLPSLYWIDSSHSNGINYGLTYNVKLGDSGSVLYPFVHRSSREINRMVSAFLVDDVNAGIRAPESTVASEKLIKWMYDYTKKFGFGYPSSFVGPRPEGTPTGYQGASGMVSGSFFSEVDDVTTVNVARLDLKADSYKKNHSFFSEWAEYGFRYAIGGISTDLDLNLSEKIVAIEEDWQLAGNSDKLYYAEMDESAMQNCYNKSKANDSTMYLVRFNVSQYYMHPLTVDMDGKSYSDIAYMAEEDVYLNLHVLELTYENELGVKTAIPVSSNHIDCVARITTEKTPEQIDKQAGEELAAKIGRFWDGILDKFKEIGKILALILGIVALVLIAVFVVPVVSPIFKAIFNTIGSFFRWIGETFKGASAKRKQRRSGRK